ncbi:hypothetical protein F5X96DRAFT_665326 [Biscogniauxia mediterranea]|nr:hypothetical protein F5X96DRAFT_665326 [Biscogniauxia mediterranea]
MTPEKLATVLAEAKKNFNSLQKAEAALRKMQKTNNLFAYGMLGLALVGGACFFWQRGKKHENDEPRPQPPPASPEPIEEYMEKEADLMDRILAEKDAEQNSIFSDFHRRFPEYPCEEDDEFCTACGTVHERDDFIAWIH